jgi:hypothetical protein
MAQNVVTRYNASNALSNSPSYVYVYPTLIYAFEFYYYRIHYKLVMPSSHYKGLTLVTTLVMTLVTITRPNPCNKPCNKPCNVAVQ